MPEVCDIYIYSEVVLPRGNSEARDRFIWCKCDADGNPIGRSNDNKILDNRWYKVEFVDGEVT